VENVLGTLRIVSRESRELRMETKTGRHREAGTFIRLLLPVNLATGPALAGLFLIAISVIHRQEVYYGTIGTGALCPLDVMAFCLTMSYISMSIDSTGLLRLLTFRIVIRSGEVAHRLFFFINVAFFISAAIFGNDPVIEVGTSFNTYMLQASSNLVHPRAWIYTHFALGNVASAILVSSNPANIVISDAFNIRYIDYTANMIVPVMVTAVLLLPFLLYIVFASEELIPFTIRLHELPEELRCKKPVNPLLLFPEADEIIGYRSPSGLQASEEEKQYRALEEILNPFLSKASAVVATLVMALALVTLLTLSATSSKNEQYPVFWVTLPAAFITFTWQMGFGWYNRHQTRYIVSQCRMEVERKLAERLIIEDQKRVTRQDFSENSGRWDQQNQENHESHDKNIRRKIDGSNCEVTCNSAQASERQMNLEGKIDSDVGALSSDIESGVEYLEKDRPPMPGCIDSGSTSAALMPSISPGHQIPGFNETVQFSRSSLGQRQEKGAENGSSPIEMAETLDEEPSAPVASESQEKAPLETRPNWEASDEGPDPDIERRVRRIIALRNAPQPTTAISLLADVYRWSKETFPENIAVMIRLPYALVPYILCMSTLVQALASTGWIEAFAYLWGGWVAKTGPVGSIFGMVFLSTVVCNVSALQVVPFSLPLRSTEPS
jgi:Na+/H+ antiporter NhaD/arsenite permease-like protein